MRWTCSHCGDSQFLAEEVIGTGWFFSKCPACAGHSLVKKLEVTVIKVNSAPPGETILHPESRSRSSLHTVAGFAPSVSADSAKFLSRKAQAHLQAIPPPFRVKNSAPEIPVSPLTTHAPTRARSIAPLLLNFVIVFGMIASIALITGSGYFFYREYRARMRTLDRDRIEEIQAAPRRAQGDAGSQR